MWFSLPAFNKVFSNVLFSSFLSFWELGEAFWVCGVFYGYFVTASFSSSGSHRNPVWSTTGAKGEGDWERVK